MTLADELIAQQNPWWVDVPGWESSDAHLRRLAEQPVRLPSMSAEVVPLDRPAIHTLRGPRQVGKSTDLKLIVRRALAQGVAPRRVIYLSFEPLVGQTVAKAVEMVNQAKSLAGGSGPAVVLLDEVTAVREWQAAVMHLFETGVIDHDVVVCTGSSAVDLRSGSHERLPGRRREGVDHLVTPRGFATFAGAVDRLVPASPGLLPADLVSPAGRAQLEDARVLVGRLDRCLRLYARFGGLPAAVAEAAAGSAAPSAGTRRIFSDALVGEMLRKGASESATRALLERVLRSLSAKVSWRRLAAEMDVPLGAPGRHPAPSPTGATVRDYMQFLADAYFLLIVYFWKPDSGTSGLARDKKIYFADPLLHTIALDAAPGLAEDLPALVENLVAVALYRRCEPVARQADSQSDPDALHVYGTRAGGEIDFVCGPRASTVAVEVKYQSSPDLRKAAAIPKALPGRPALIVTKDTLEFREQYVLVPAALFLWAVG